MERRELVADVELLYTTYAEALDDGDVARWPSFFADDGPFYRITTRDNLEQGMELCLALCEGQAMLRDRAIALQKTVMYRRRFQRRITNGVRLLTFDGLEGEGVKARATFAVFEAMGDEPSKLLVCGRSSDVIVRQGSELKFKDRLCVVDCRVIPDSLIFPI
ncbi:MAG TPA: salicylate hydroxylase [Stellaceae bacterium]|nr:salicylate hydroxylase [Stellaceae bacterium]